MGRTNYFRLVINPQRLDGKEMVVFSFLCFCNMFNPNGTIDARTLAGLLGITKATTFKILKKLESDGLLVRDGK